MAMIGLPVIADKDVVFKMGKALVRFGRGLLTALLLGTATFVVPGHAAVVGAQPLKLVVLGDSLVAGLGLKTADTFPVQLQKALAADGMSVAVVNAGVSGDTASDGLARLDWSVGPDADAVIVEFGANDALRGLDPQATRTALDAILQRLKARHLPVLLAGMLAPPNMGQGYAAAFDVIFPDLAKSEQVPLYPFFLDGVATHPELEQSDGMHPDPAGVEIIVQHILPAVESLLAPIHPQ